MQALNAGLRRIFEMQGANTDGHIAGDIARLRGEYENRIEHLKAQIDSAVETPAPDVHTFAEKEALRAERTAVMNLRDRGDIPDDIFLSIQYDLDLAESRLA